MPKNKALVSLVIGLGLILVAGLAVLVWGLQQQAADPNFKFFKNSSAPPAGPVAPVTSGTLPADITISLPPGYRVSSMEVVGPNIYLHITNDRKRDRILILDSATGAVLRRIHINTKP